MTETNYYPRCGDEVSLSDAGVLLGHKTVLTCVDLCPFCGGFTPEDERYELQPDDRCECPR